MRTMGIVGALSLAALMSGADLTGVVVADHDGSPVVAAAVTVRQGTKVVGELETDDQGRFRAPGIASGQYTLNVSKANFAPTDRNIAVASGDRILTIRLMRYGVITGTVIDTMGQGVRNAVVAAIPSSPDGSIKPPRTTVSSAAADARGRFRVHSLKPGYYVVAMTLGEPRQMIPTPNGVTPDTSLGNDVQIYPSNAHPQVFTVRGGEELKVDFTAYKGAMFNVRGTVTGVPEGAGFTVFLQKSDLPVMRLAAAGSTPAGGFQFTRVPPGSYRLLTLIRPNPVITIVDGRETLTMPTQIETSFGEASVVVGSQDVEGVTIAPSRSVARAKVVYRPTGGCPQQASVLFTALEDWGVGINQRSLQAGVEQPFQMPPVRYAIDLTTNGPVHCFAQQAEIDLRQGAPDAAIQIVGAPFATIKGKVDTSSPTEDFEVELSTEGKVPASLMLDANSRFSFPDLMPGKYRISVFKTAGDRSKPAATQDLDVSSGSSLEIEFPGIQ